jgi:hypothetical protein
MADVEFEENKTEYQYAPVQESISETPWMIRKLLKWGVIKEEKQGNYVLVIIILICIGIIIYFTLQNSNFRTPNNTQKTYEESIQKSTQDPNVAGSSKNFSFQK